MNLKHLRNVVLRNLNLFLITFFISIIGATFINTISPRVYESTTDIFVSTPAAGLDISTLVAGSTFSQQRVKSYAEIINSPMTLQPVIDKLKLDISPAELTRMVRATAPLDTVIIKISVKNSDAQLASLLANAIARQFELTAAELEITDGAGLTQVKVSTVRESVPSLYPISPKPKINYLFGLAFAFLFSIGVGLIREIFDQTVKNESHITKSLLGVIDFDPEVDSEPISNSDSYSNRSESFRQIRVNVLDILGKRKLNSIGVSSSISGEGKSSFVANLAYSIALTGKKVCILECDMRRPTLVKFFSRYAKSPRSLRSGGGMSQLLTSEQESLTLLKIRKSISKVEVSGTTFDFIPCGVIPPDPAELLSKASLSKIISTLKKSYDLVLVDSPPTLPIGDALVIGKSVEGVILLAKAGIVRKKQLKTTIGFHENLGNHVLGVCLNMAPLIDRAEEYGYQSSKHVYDSTYSYKNYYRNSSKTPYAPIDSMGTPKTTLLDFFKRFYSR